MVMQLENILTKVNPIFSKVSTFFFDLDGCIFSGNVLAIGADTLIGRLKKAGKKVCFITNNSRQTSIEIADKLLHMGLNVSPEEIFTATDYSGRYIADKYGIARVKVVGSSGLSSALASVGHKVLPIEDDDSADVIVVGRDIEFTYDKLYWISWEVNRGAKVIAVNPDLFHPGSEGERVPETGALIAAIEAVIGQSVEYVGKPEPHLFYYGMEACGAKAQECVMVGDNYDTDIIGGKRAGMYTVWLNGTTEKRHELPNQVKPDADVILSNILDFMKELDRLIIQ
jgi:HAD superfamily hydrolase (TIGR01450 family)